jgi:hypothetical protein
MMPGIDRELWGEMNMVKRSELKKCKNVSGFKDLRRLGYYGPALFWPF